MEDKLRAAFDSVHAETELKERTMAFLTHTEAEAPARRRPAGRRGPAPLPPYRAGGKNTGAGMTPAPAASLP